jgi:hypothetical protein
VLDRKSPECRAVALPSTRACEPAVSRYLHPKKEIPAPGDAGQRKAGRSGKAVRLVDMGSERLLDRDRR